MNTGHHFQPQLPGDVDDALSIIRSALTRTPDSDSEPLTVVGFHLDRIATALESLTGDRVPALFDGDAVRVQQLQALAFRLREPLSIRRAMTELHLGAPSTKRLMRLAGLLTDNTEETS